MFKRLTIRSLLALPALLPCLLQAAETAPEGLDKIAQPFFAQHCTSCHGEKKQKGDLRVDTLKIDFDSPKTMAHWEEIMSRINSGDMPPPKEARPKPEDISKLADWITIQLHEAEAFRQATGTEKISFRKLSREEYTNSIKELLGVTYDATDPTGLPEDPDWHGFQRIGSVLTLSPAHVEKYMTAADLVLTEALALGPQPKRENIVWNAFKARAGWDGLEKVYTDRGTVAKVRVDVVPKNGINSTPGEGKDFVVKTTGDYIVRIKLSALRPANGRSPRLRVYFADISRVLFEQDVEIPEDKPETIEFRAHLPAGKHSVLVQNSIPGPNPEDRRSRADGPHAFTDLKSRQPWQMKLTDEDYKPLQPMLLVDSVEWDGPVVESWPTPAHKQIFFKGENATKDLAYAREIVTRFARRAYRRPIQELEADRLVQLIDKSQKLGDSFEVAVKTGLQAVLCSKNFLYIEEGNSAKLTPKLTDWELASRLSYFLWSNVPDAKLQELAEAGKLHETETLRTEVRRMLADPKAAEFAETFPHQWLQLRRVGMFTPDKTLYPDYDDSLEKSMIAETISFFKEVLTKNASVREFLDSDWTMLNERLATHYGIAGVKGEAMQRVALKPEDHRGGVLTQGAILSLTSDGTRHRPVHRGVWVLESLLNRPPPPPPANVPPIETPPATAPKTTLRAKLELHRSDPNCTACHNKIDPLGLAFENYDAIGRWRTTETLKAGAGDDPKLDPSGQLADGRKFSNAIDLKKILMDDSDRFALAFTEKLATYALRRAMAFSDREVLKHLTEQSKANDYKLATLIESLVTSELFLKR